MKHDAKKFAQKLDFLTTPGYLTGPGAREAAGLPAGTGPHRVITDLCVLDFHPQTKRMRVKSLHPGKTLEQVRAATGFELDACDPLTTTVEPNEQQLTRPSHGSRSGAVHPRAGGVRSKGAKGANFCGDGIGALAVQNLVSKAPSEKPHKGSKNHSDAFCLGFPAFRYGGGHHRRNINSDMIVPSDFGPKPAKNSPKCPKRAP